MTILGLFFFSACRPSHQEDVDKLNDLSYTYHYKNIDSTYIYAQQALTMSEDYPSGKAEAYNHLAFVGIARMNYKQAEVWLDSVAKTTDNQIELLVAAVQQMRLCQRKSQNKDFYDYHEIAVRTLRRIEEEPEHLTERERRRLVYAKSEMSLVTSTYYYYVGLEQQSIDALYQIDVNEVESDTAQYLNYLYQIGAGGIINQGTADKIYQEEWDYLMTCYRISKKQGLIYWEANSLQAMSEHMFEKEHREKLIADNLPAMKFVNTEQVADSLLPGYLAEKSLKMFEQYGDVYQTSGAFRTLASCYWALGLYNDAGYFLEMALECDSAIYQAPDLVASIKERLSLTFSAIDNKVMSDSCRNQYLDLQERTRQDQQLEARAEQLRRSSSQLNIMLWAVGVMIVAVVISLYIFYSLRRRKYSSDQLNSLLEPLNAWKNSCLKRVEEQNERYEELNEQRLVNELHIDQNKKRNVEARAKVFLVNSILPLIDRIIHEVGCIKSRQEPETVKRERFDYMLELTDNINDYNNVLTQWIQLQQGQISLHVESFRLQELFDLVSRSQMSFQLKGIELKVEKTDAVVKADRILTIFMLNTIADNARKFTGKGGTVTISASPTEDGANYEISIQDTGVGISQEELDGIFDHKVSGGHGFGLMNCKGIIEKYRKVSQIFSSCMIGAESQQSKGSRFYFRLPKGVVRLLVVLTMLTSPFLGAGEMMAKTDTDWLTPACAYTDSTYYCNLRGDYHQAVLFADSALTCFNRHYQNTYDQNQPVVLLNDQQSAGEPAELQWFHKGVDTNYSALIYLRNEIAVAALALHDWSLYQYNNRVYTQLYKENSADRHLGEYVRTMQRSEVNKTIAVVLLVILLLVIIVAYYILYYRHLLQFRFCVEQVQQINGMLLEDRPSSEKLNQLDAQVKRMGNVPPRLQSIVSQIREALYQRVETEKKQTLTLELAQDERNRAELENQKLYVSNNVLDNCLSTLKHETMYYPSRIRQLVEEKEVNVQALDEVTAYYKELYSILSAQAMRQVDGIKHQCKAFMIHDVFVMGEEQLIRYMFDILQKQGGGKELRVTSSEKEGRYVVFQVEMPQIAYREFFVPSMENVPYMICRQIVRENSESTNLRGCGIVAEEMEGVGTRFLITLAKGKAVQHISEKL